MITIPTGEFTGLLSDVIPFVYPDDELVSLNCVRLEWDGRRMHALSTDRFRIAWSQWDPTDDPDEDVQEDLFTEWGGADDPWGVTLPLAEAKALVKNYKLPVKEAVHCPLTLDFDRETLTVVRSRDTGYSALKATVDGLGALAADFPNVRALLANQDVLLPVRNLSFTAKYLADFAKVRPRGALEMRFTGPKTLVHVSIGERFTGAIMPVRLSDDPGTTPRPDTEGGVDGD